MGYFRKKWAFRLLAVFTGLASLLYSGFALALPTGSYGSGSYGSCQYGADCSISLTSNGNISLNVTPAGGGKCTIQSDSVSVFTDDSDGYTLTLADSGTNTALVNGGASIPATSGSLSSPASLGSNNWGYRVDGLGSFGSGPTTSQSNASPSGTPFAGVVSNLATPDTIATTLTAADPAVTTTVWYGACADTTVASGAYSTQVIYTAVAN